MVDIVGKYLIFETVEQQLTDAIHNHQKVALYYKGYKGTPNPKTGKKQGSVKDFTDQGIRIGLPVALGLEKHTGRMVVRMLVTSKGVHTKGRTRKTKWRLFRIDRIKSVYEQEGKDDIVNDEPDLLNISGDDQMSIVYAHANDKISFGGENGKRPETDEVPVYSDVQAQSIPIKPKPRGHNKLDKIPDDAKVILKQPEKPKPLEKLAPPKVTTKPIMPPTPEKVPPIEPIKPELPIKPEPEITEPDEENSLLGLSEQIKNWRNWLIN